MTDNFVIEGTVMAPVGPKFSVFVCQIPPIRTEQYRLRNRLQSAQKSCKTAMNCFSGGISLARYSAMMHLGCRVKRKNRGSQGLEIVDGPCYDKCVESERKSRYFVDFRLQEVGSAANTLLYTM